MESGGWCQWHISSHQFHMPLSGHVWSAKRSVRLEFKIALQKRKDSALSDKKSSFAVRCRPIFQVANNDDYRCETILNRHI
jgi:hypothetical protein